MKEKENPLYDYLRGVIDEFAYMTGRVIHGERKLAENVENFEQKVVALREEKETYFKLSKDYYKEKIDKEIENNELKERLKKLEAKVEELEERVDIEVETNLEALEISKK
jgi:uncharacterized protein YktB (UPF0637 family)